MEKGTGMALRRIPAGTELIRQGDFGFQAWMVEAGELEVSLEGPDGARVLGVAGPGAILGEMALLDNGPRSATVRALTEVTAIEVSRATFRAMVAKCPPLTRYLLESLIAAIRRTYGLDTPERADGAEPVRTVCPADRVAYRRLFNHGHVFFRRHDEGTAAYLIQSGRVRIEEVEGGDAILGPGRVFGELALITDRPRLATAVALEGTVCELIRKDDFARALAAMPTILRHLTRVYVERLAGRPARLAPRAGGPRAGGPRLGA
nr:cyclic nucleotide-binding domain-containing protein [Azospirillum sp. SYSU D00513]